MKILLLLTCLIGTAIDESLSASTMGFESDEALDEFFFVGIHLASIHIPTILTMSQQKKNKICKAAVETSAFKEFKTSYIDQITMPKVRKYLKNRSDLKKYFTDGNLDKDPLCPVSVQKLMLFNNVNVGNQEVSIPEDIYIPNKTVQVKEIMIECLCGERGVFGNHKIKSIFLSYAYADNTYAVIAPLLGLENLNLMSIVELSPTHVLMSQEELERHYLKYRLPIEKLLKEQPKIAKLAETRGPIKSLYSTEASRLCGSVIQSDFYRGKKITANLNENPKILRKPLAFRTKGLYKEKEPLLTHNVVCECSDKNSKPMELLLTHSFNDEDSVFVQIEVKGKLYLDSYMRDIVVLKQNRQESQVDLTCDENCILL